MAVNVRVSVSGLTELNKALRAISPQHRPKILRDGLLAIGLEIQRDATQNQIIRGGGKNAPVNPHRITSRTGYGRRSIRVNRKELPHAIEVGSDVGYMAVHEIGGTVRVPRHVVAAHTRRVAFGVRTKPFVVPEHFRGPYTVRYPARPWLKPAVEAVTPRMPLLFLSAWEKALSNA
jgi:hypothetical protein